MSKTTRAVRCSLFAHDVTTREKGSVQKLFREFSASFECFYIHALLYDAFPPQFLFPARLSHDTALFFALCLSRCVRSLVRYDTARDWGCRCCDAVLSRDESKRGRALASLREDPGLQQLLPHLCTFIQSKVSCVSSNILSRRCVPSYSSRFVPSDSPRCVLHLHAVKVHCVRS